MITTAEHTASSTAQSANGYRYILLVDPSPPSATMHKSVFGSFKDAPFIHWSKDGHEACALLFQSTGTRSFWPAPCAIILDDTSPLPGTHELLTNVRQKMGMLPTILLTNTPLYSSLPRQDGIYYMQKAHGYEETRQRYHELIEQLQLS